MLKLWDLSPSVIKPSSSSNAKVITNVIITYCVLTAAVVSAEICGVCQKKFVWTTAWPMEENYVTYKLIGPLAEQQESFATARPNEPNQQRSRENKYRQQNYFMYLSTPKDFDENDRSVEGGGVGGGGKVIRTEPIDRFDRIGLKTEAELDELPCRMDLFNTDEHQHLASLVNLGSFEKNGHSNFSDSGQRSVFSERKSDDGQSCALVPKYQKLELLSKPQRGRYISSTANAKSHQLPNSCSSKVITKADPTPVNVPELINLAKAQLSLESKDMVQRVHDPSDKIDDPSQWGVPIHHRPVAKKIRPSFSLVKSKTMDSPQLTKSTKGKPIDESMFNQLRPLTSGNSKFNGIADPASNILKIIKIDSDPFDKSSSSEALPGPTADLKASSNKIQPLNENTNIPVVKMSAARPILKATRLGPPFEEINTKEIISAAKNGRFDMKQADANVAKRVTKPGKTTLKRGERAGNKKRRAYPISKENRDKMGLQDHKVFHPRIRLPIRFRQRKLAFNNLSSNNIAVNNNQPAAASNNTNLLTSWFKDITSK